MGFAVCEVCGRVGNGGVGMGGVIWFLIGWFIYKVDFPTEGGVYQRAWIPACAGMAVMGAGMTVWGPG